MDPFGYRDVDLWSFRLVFFDEMNPLRESKDFSELHKNPLPKMLIASTSNVR
jgi:hypothetical protein